MFKRRHHIPAVKPPIILIISITLISMGQYHPAPERQLNTYTFTPETSLISRVGTPPGAALSYLQKLDKRPDYSPYIPGKNERELIRRALRKLPPLTRAVLQTRLVGIYFINNFITSGMSESVIGPGGKIYSFMVFNPSVLKKSAGRLLTEKEMTCFIMDNPSFRIAIQCPGVSGFQYILLHESTHVVDYARQVTPYTDTGIIPYLKKKKEATPFTQGIWNGYAAAAHKYKFSGRVAFYSIKKPGLKISESPDIYRALFRSPFITLYGTMSWAEDLAEMLAMYHITRHLHSSFTISVYKNKKRTLSIRPLESPAVMRRFKRLKIFYAR